MVDGNRDAVFLQMRCEGVDIAQAAEMKYWHRQPTLTRINDETKLELESRDCKSGRRS